MQVRRRAPSRRAVLLFIFFAVAALVVVSTFTAGQGKSYAPRNNQQDKRNKELGEVYGANPANDCWAHHKGEGMRDAFIVYPVIPQQLKVGERYEIDVQIINPWKQEVRKMSLDVSLLGETQILTVEAAAASVAAKRDIFIERTAVLNNPNAQGVPGAPASNVTFAFEVPNGASAITSYVELRPRGSPLIPIPNNEDRYDVKFRTPVDSTNNGGNHYQPGGSSENDTVLNRTYAAPVKTNGTHFIDITHRAGLSAQTDVFVNATIVMGGGGPSGARTYSIPIPPDAIIAKGGEPYVAKIPVTPFAAGQQAMEIHVRAENYYKHQLASTPNEDFYNRYQNLSESADFIVGSSITPTRMVMVGNAFVASDVGVATEQVGDQWQFVLAEVTGFAAAGLLLPSLLLGGTYGKASRRFLNNILGGAKRRVMFHNLSSLALSLVAFVHIILFVLEIRYTILMGVMWGGFGALSLLILGLTGYYQVPLIQRHGYKWWRYTHLAFGLLVVVFVSYHMIADGPDFFFLKERIPKWINDINLAQK